MLPILLLTLFSRIRNMATLELLTSPQTLTSDQQFLKNVVSDRKLNLTTTCRTSLIHLKESLNAGQEWAKMMSSSIKHRAPDIRSGQLADFGDFDSCISIHRPEIALTGKYCLYRQHFNLSHAAHISLISKKPSGFHKMFRLETVAGSICMPSLCRDDEVEMMVQKYLSLPGTRTEIRSGCETMDRMRDQSLADEESVYLTCLILWVIFVFLATCLASTLESDFLKCFSISDNTSQIVRDDGSGEHSFLYGYRFLFLVVACAMHIFELQIFWSPLVVINIYHFDSIPYSGLTKMIAAHFSHSMGSNFVWAGEFETVYVENILANHLF